MPLDNREDLIFNNLLESHGFCSASVRSLFGNNFNWNNIENLNIIEEGPNLWVWRYHSCKASIASSVYDHVSNSNTTEASWLGWSIIWKLPTLSRVKVFLWKLAHGRLSTGGYLFQLNIGPRTTCPLCGLTDETTEHLIWNYSKISQCWHEVFARIGWNQNDILTLSSGSWLLKNIHGRDLDLRAKALIAAIAWLIWKSRCKLIFNNQPINFSSIVPNAWNLYCNRPTFTFREFPRTSQSNNSIKIFTDASWCMESRLAGLGFIIISNVNQILIAGAIAAVATSPIMAEIVAINLALQLCISNDWLPSSLFCDCAGIAQLLKNFNACTAWHIKEEYQLLKQNLGFFPYLFIETIPREDNAIADALASFGRNCSQLSLFFQGLDRPHWLDDLCNRHHLFF
ncbi:uncharacterized protein LOC120272581 [Dioscorea cayenensis subsp. rotundata]|uniref:Uncharacterized protein LOC120272581 n=1 Tax=Dioscorea cayennensis subsp. rotundata TaxID=55577 RepID=A0AB40CAK9_DIOCR|nr:uncharacterized protein LOC120272581 [Dioscorea cayenensis subsp. rotundata]